MRKLKQLLLLLSILYFSNNVLSQEVKIRMLSNSEVKKIDSQLFKVDCYQTSNTKKISYKVKDIKLFDSVYKGDFMVEGYFTKSMVKSGNFKIFKLAKKSFVLFAEGQYAPICYKDIHLQEFIISKDDTVNDSLKSEFINFAIKEYSLPVGKWRFLYSNGKEKSVLNFCDKHYLTTTYCKPQNDSLFILQPLNYSMLFSGGQFFYSQSGKLVKKIHKYESASTLYEYTYSENIISSTKIYCFNINNGLLELKIQDSLSNKH